jgi:hypothetical protein
MMQTSIAAASLLVGIVLAAVLTLSFDARQDWLAWALGQVIIAAVLAVGLRLASRHQERALPTAPHAIRAWMLIMMALVVTLGIGIVSDPVRRSLGGAMGAVMRVFGIYPSGADVWLPIGMIIWIISSLVPVALAVLAANLLRDRST